jgi:Uma2 family endonuclease
MHVPRTRHTTSGPRPAGPEPRDEALTEPEDALDKLEALFWSLGEIPGHRTEILEGQIVVSPSPVLWHNRVVTWLIRQFDQTCDANGWEHGPGVDVPLPPTRDIAEPDYLILKDPEKFSDVERIVPVDHVLLVSEVVSPSSKRADREVKWLSYAKAAIPFYLLVDRFVQPVTITLFSEPGQDGYGRADAVQAGPGVGKLHVPSPFDVTLDTSLMPMPRG